MTTKRIYYYDVLNVVSCISVIALHCNGYVHRFDTADQCWWLHVLFEVAFYNAVPIFFMLSGATLLGYHKKYDTRTFFIKRLRKAFLPFLFWSVVFFLFAAVFTHTEFTPGSVAQKILTCRIPFTDYWFFVPLFLLYIFMPFLSVMVSHLKDSQVLCLVMLIVGLQAIVKPVSLQVNVEWDLPMGSYVAYALLGYYLSRTSWEQNRRVIIAVALMALLFMSLRYVLVLDSVYKKPVLWTYLSLYGYFGSATIFLLVKRLCTNSGGGEPYPLPFGTFIRSVPSSAVLYHLHHHAYVQVDGKQGLSSLRMDGSGDAGGSVLFVRCGGVGVAEVPLLPLGSSELRT